MSLPKKNSKKENLKEGLKRIGFFGLLGTILAGIIVAVIGMAFEDVLMVLTGIFLFSFPFGIMRFCLETETTESKIGALIFSAIITLMAFGLVYLHTINYFS